MSAIMPLIDLRHRISDGNAVCGLCGETLPKGTDYVTMTHGLPGSVFTNDVCLACRRGEHPAQVRRERVIFGVVVAASVAVVLLLAAVFGG